MTDQDRTNTFMAIFGDFPFEKALTPEETLRMQGDIPVEAMASLAEELKRAKQLSVNTIPSTPESSPLTTLGNTGSSKPRDYNILNNITTSLPATPQNVPAAKVPVPNDMSRQPKIVHKNKISNLFKPD